MILQDICFLSVTVVITSDLIANLFTYNINLKFKLIFNF